MEDGQEEPQIQLGKSSITSELVVVPTTGFRARGCQAPAVKCDPKTEKGCSEKDLTSAAGSDRGSEAEETR